MSSTGIQKDSKLSKGRNTIGGLIHQVSQQSKVAPIKHRPNMIKLSPKMNFLNKSGSEQIFNPQNLDTISEGRDIGNELISEDPQVLKSRYSDPVSMKPFITDQEDLKVIKEQKSISSCEPKSSADKNDADTNDSGIKVSGTTQEKTSEERKDSDTASPTGEITKDDLENPSNDTKYPPKTETDEDSQSEEISIEEDNSCVQRVHNSKLKKHGFFEHKNIKAPYSEIKPHFKKQMNNELCSENSKDSFGMVKKSESDLYKEKGDFNISLSVYNSYTVRRERKKGFRETGTPCSKADSSNLSIPTDKKNLQKESKQKMSPQVPMHKIKPQESPLTIMKQKPPKAIRRNGLKKKVKQCKSAVDPLLLLPNKTTIAKVHKIVNLTNTDIKKSMKKSLEVSNHTETYNCGVIRQTKWLSKKAKAPAKRNSQRLPKKLIRKIKSTQRNIKNYKSK